MTPAGFYSVFFCGSQAPQGGPADFFQGMGGRSGPGNAAGFVRRGVKVAAGGRGPKDAALCPDGWGVCTPTCFGAALLFRRRSGRESAWLASLSRREGFRKEQSGGYDAPPLPHRSACWCKPIPSCLLKPASWPADPFVPRIPSPLPPCRRAPSQKKLDRGR